MFTGLIEGTGTLIRTERAGTDAKMILRADFDAGRLVLGESIAVNGACLTVVSFQGTTFTADVSVETLNRTTLGSLKPGARLNLERALRLGDRLGGHLVSGHVDGLGTVRQRQMDGRSWRFFFVVPEELGRYIVEKGSVAINGISLTVNGSSADEFDVNIVPHTFQETNIGDLKPGDKVNIETDIIGKYVERFLSAWKPDSQSPQKDAGGGINMAFLRDHGF